MAGEYTRGDLERALAAMEQALSERWQAVLTLSDQEAARVLDDYHAAYEALRADFQRLWERTFGRGVTPSAAELYRMLASEGLAAVIEQRIAELEGKQIGASDGRGGFSGGALQEAIRNAAAIGHVGALREIGAILRPDYLGTFTSLNPAVTEVLLAQAVADTRNLSSALRDAVTSELRQGVLLGEGMDELAGRIAVLERIGKTRGELITRWSVMRAHNVAAADQYARAAAYVPGLQKVWRAELDDKTCPMCAALNGEVVSVEAEFSHTEAFGGKALPVYQGILDVPPRHPRCRCTILPWTVEWEGLAATSPADLRRESRDWAAARGLVDEA